MNRNEVGGYVLGVAGAVLFSSKAVVVKLAYGHHIDAETLLALRMLCSLPLYLTIGGINLWRRAAHGETIPSPRSFAAALGVGILGYWLASYLDFLGLSWISATFERLILFTYPLFVVIRGWAFFKAKLGVSIVPAFVISYAGLALVFSEHQGGMDNGADGSHLALGAGLVLGCAVAFALYQLLAKAPIARLGSEQFTSVARTGASVASALVFACSHPLGELGVVTTILPHAAFLAIGATVIPSYLLNGALARISAQANGAIGMISPISTIFLAALFLHEPLSMTEAAGAALVLGGVIVFVWGQKRFG
jgi:drug/metabolite transporter (DMT)-like permease